MSVVPVHSTVLSFEDARRVVAEQASQVQSPVAESVDLLDTAGRVIAEPVAADRDLPPFPRSTRDGYAVRAADVSRLPATLHLMGEIKAGEKLEAIPANVSTGETVAIMTGAPVPAGADAVVMVEYTSREGERVEITRGVSAGENIVPRGAEAKQGSHLLERGQRLTEAAIALAASVGKRRLRFSSVERLRWSRPVTRLWAWMPRRVRPRFATLIAILLPYKFNDQEASRCFCRLHPMSRTDCGG